MVPSYRDTYKSCPNISLTNESSYYATSVLLQPAERNLNITRTVQSDRKVPHLMSKTWSNNSLQKSIKTSEHYNGVVEPLRIFDPKISVREVFERNKLSNPIQLIIKKYHLRVQYWLSSSE